jgi:N-acyl-D-aspartate/D-glutamate deacylase
MSEAFDSVIEHGLVFDGRGSPPRQASVGVREGVVRVVSEAPLPKGPRTRVIDARGCWVTPGFIDIHTHYDAELELAPSLSESVRHGVTTVTLGSCSLSLAVGNAEDLADQFCRVEAIPHAIVLDLLQKRKTWETQPGYFDHLSSLPLGANVMSFMGHSALRAHVMGIDRSLRRDVVPTEDEFQKMEAMVEQGLDAGYLGLSIQKLPWDKMGGSRYFRSRPLPSSFARFSEFRRLARPLRRRGRVLQALPNLSTRYDIFAYLAFSTGLFRRALKTTVLSMADPRAGRWIYRASGLLSRIANRLLGADFRWQALPEVFDLWADGIDLVVFEEFGAGAAALHLEDQVARAELLRDARYRERFKRHWRRRFLPRAFHRDFNQSLILKCPDLSVVGKSFATVAEERHADAVDAFLDLVAEHGRALRWYTVMANDRPGPLSWIVSHPDVLVGFSDAGAHLRNMAHYNFPLRMLRLARDSGVMPPERAVWRLTGEIADWVGVDAGHLEPGGRADIAVVDPTRLSEVLDRPVEAEVENFGGFVRLVSQNGGAVRSVLVNGKVAVDAGAVRPELGKAHGFGRVLRVRTPGDRTPL